jgi:hypothetical protein
MQRPEPALHRKRRLKNPLASSRRIFFLLSSLRWHGVNHLARRGAKRLAIGRARPAARHFPDAPGNHTRAAGKRWPQLFWMKKMPPRFAPGGI